MPPNKRVLPVRTMQASKILARLSSIHYWPFKDKQFAALINESKDDEIEMLAYCAIGSTDEDFRSRIERAYNAKYQSNK